jgi:hypothetical protein
MLQFQISQPSFVVAFSACSGGVGTGPLSKPGFFAVQHLRIHSNWLNYMQLKSRA